MMRFFDLFTPPNGYGGDFGWVCGFTAEADVMREIANRFTLNAGSFIATHRRPALCLITDPASPQITPIEAVGIHHMTLASSWRQAFQGRGIFHAKVALLHFTEEASAASDNRKSVLRLVVSTGNWTRETMARNIDMFWKTEVTVGDPNSDPQAIADIQHSYAMFKAIRPHLSPNPWITPTRRALNEAPYSGLHRIVEKLPASGSTPRFFHSLNAPLRGPMIERFKTSAAGKMLLMGSGFFAGGDPGPIDADQSQGAEAFLNSLADELTQSVKKPTRSLVLNPDACQNLAKVAPAMAKQGWNFLKPKFAEDVPDGSGKLHAKFIYSGRPDRLDGMLYIGSGNLTPAGMGGHPKAGLWNFEAGVVLDVSQKGELHEHLPFDASQAIDLSKYQLSSGDAFEMSVRFSGDCPVTHFVLKENDTASALVACLTVPDLTRIDISHSGQDWQPLQAEVALDSSALPPATVRVRFKLGANVTDTVIVPVFSENGAQIIPDLHRRRLEDVLDALLQFSLTGREPVAENHDQENDDESRGGSSGNGLAHQPSQYSARRLMAVITALGETQAELPLDQCRLWANRMVEHARSITRTEPQVLQELRDMKLNPFLHLSRPEFLPLNNDADTTAILTAAHELAADLWGVGAYRGFDGVPA